MKRYDRFFTYWAFVCHILFLWRPETFPNTLTLAIFVFAGSIFNKYFVAIQKNQNAWSIVNHVLFHYMPLIIILFMQDFREYDFDSRVLILSFSSYLLYHSFDLHKIYNFYRFTELM